MMENSEAGTESFSDKLSATSFEVDFRAVRVSLLVLVVARCEGEGGSDGPRSL